MEIIRISPVTSIAQFGTSDTSGHAGQYPIGEVSNIDKMMGNVAIILYYDDAPELFDCSNQCLHSCLLFTKCTNDYDYDM